MNKINDVNNFFFQIDLIKTFFKNYGLIDTILKISMNENKYHLSN